MKKVTLLLVLYLFTGGLKAQKDKTNDSIPASKTDIENVYKKLNELVNNTNPGSEKFGYFRMKDSVPVFYRATSQQKKDSLQWVKIKQVNISTRKGFIDNIIIETADGSVFGNKQSMISLPLMYDRMYDTLRAYIKGTNIKREVKANDVYLVLADALEFKTNHPKRYIPADTEFELWNSKDTAWLQMQNDIDYQASLRFYTDMVGLANKDNPILQLEMNSQFILNNKNRRNARWIWLHYLEPYVGLNKFDSKFDTIRYNAKTENDSLSRMDLWRKSNLVSGVKLNVVSYYRFVDLFVNVGLQYNQARNVYVKDTTDDKINLYSFYVEGRLLKENNKSFGYSTGMKLFVNTPFAKPSFPNNKMNFIVGTDAEVFWKPDVKKNSNLFFRFYMFNNLSASERNTVQLQLGYNASLNDWFKKQTAGN